MNPKKVYAIDPAISNRLGFKFSENKGRVLENIVYLELLRRGKEVYYHAGKVECDFIIKEGLKITSAMQVAWNMEPLNRQRELKGLQEAMKEYGLKQGLIITGEEEGGLDQDDLNITLIPCWKWLLGEMKSDKEVTLSPCHLVT